MSEEQQEPKEEKPNIPPHIANRKRGRPAYPELTDAEKKVVTSKQAQRALKKWKAQYMHASEWSGASEFGKFLLHKGKKEIGMAIEVYAANAMKQGIERCDTLIAQIDDPELKVRLEEAKKGYAEAMAKSGASMGKGEPNDGGPPINKPVLNVFAPNVAVSHNAVVPEPEKVIDS